MFDTELCVHDSQCKPVDLTKDEEIPIHGHQKDSTERLHEIRDDDIMEFATTAFVSLLDIKEEAKNFNLVVIQSSRHGECDRVTFGLQTKIRKVLDIPKRSLFTFNKQKGGLFSYGPKNVQHVELFMDYQEQYYEKTGLRWEKLRPSPVPQVWTKSEINFLTISRGSPNPPTFEHISRGLSLIGGVERSASECRSKWYKMFPSSSDVNDTIEHLREMKKQWPRLFIHPEKQVSKGVDGHPQLIALHIVWPWSADVMTTLSPSIFCDGTYDKTVYHYKVVMLSTFDGNHQHRPLMCSFIMNSTGAQWATIFDIFHRR